ncbi:N-acetyltransferase [Leucobacter weissii]|uniref:N-acetyltransferase n=1 Tax=Leucobacter weissii TaxID=1983706 RepID=A0A939MPV8_9MICO|nr:GNAT family N-acetyltransferase [Leucobacter weissii]MBO1900859.1 N-acetyltransferase [Leucobacter weissii]
MTGYADEKAARDDGLVISHEPERHRFVILREGALLGTAHYALHGEAGAEGAAIDFDGTEVDPALRGSGISRLLAQRALTDEIVEGRRILASCWFMAAELRRLNSA